MFDALAKAGALRPDSKGVSFGSGTELPLYAIANHVEEIWATDLYSAETAWPTACTDEPGSVTEFVRSGAAFATRRDHLFAKSMGMRTIDFPDKHFFFLRLAPPWGGSWRNRRCARIPRLGCRRR